jgi:hypothetical protein
MISDADHIWVTAQFPDGRDPLPSTIVVTTATWDCSLST